MNESLIRSSIRSSLRPTIRNKARTRATIICYLAPWSRRLHVPPTDTVQTQSVPVRVVSKSAGRDVLLRSRVGPLTGPRPRKGKRAAHRYVEGTEKAQELQAAELMQPSLTDRTGDESNGVGAAVDSKSTSYTFDSPELVLPDRCGKGDRQ